MRRDFQGSPGGRLPRLWEPAGFHPGWLPGAMAPWVNLASVGLAVPAGTRAPIAVSAATETWPVRFPLRLGERAMAQRLISLRKPVSRQSERSESMAADIASFQFPVASPNSTYPDYRHNSRIRITIFNRIPSNNYPLRFNLPLPKHR